MKTFLKIILVIFVVCFSIGVFAVGSGYDMYKEALENMPLSQKIEETKSDENYTSIDKLPKIYLDAVVAVEDHRYYDHGAIDIIGLARAVFTNIKNKELQEGGSTITQQVAKNLYFIEEDNAFRRKVAEMFMAIDIENNYSKEDILEMYINTIYFGDGYYGIKEACEGYLNKEPKDMNLAESTMMAGIPNAPSVYAPTVNKELCKQRQNKVISSMVEYGYLNQEQADSIDQSFIDNI